MSKDKVVILTGASSGIGGATARLLASKGGRLVLGARRADKLKQIATAIEDGGGRAVLQELDDCSANQREPAPRLRRLPTPETGRRPMVARRARRHTA